jgi:hypothetical protein
MGITKNIGKNTIGDNNKMAVSLHNYNMSTHDLSTIVRNTQSPGTLIPNLCIVGQKGDTFDIDIDSNVLTHPTTGPLFGSFKLEHHIYTAPVRLYNSWLHNNRTKIGLNMAQVKLPQMTVVLQQAKDNPSNNDNQWTQVNPSCLLAYLGIRGYGTLDTATKTATKNALPVLAYYDIFKNFYANTQEENFYIIGASPTLTVEINGVSIPDPDNILNSQGAITNVTPIILKPNTLAENTILLSVAQGLNARTITMTPSEIGEWAKGSGEIEITPNKVPAGSTWYIRAIYSTERTSLKAIPLENLDEIRDKILLTPGDTVFDIASRSASVEPFNLFAQRGSNNQLNSRNTQFGLCLKTYNSDLYQNWINTEWIEGVDGINEASAVDVSNGTLSMDALNLSQKVYNFPHVINFLYN